MTIGRFLITSLLSTVLSSLAAPAPAERAIMVREANIYISPDTSATKIGTVGRGRGHEDRGQDHGQDHEVTDGICVYDRRDFHGRSECWSAGAGIRDLATAGNWSDRISSIRVFGRAYAVAYRDVGFRGENIIIDRDIPDLAELSARKFRNWDRQISSLQIENERGFPGKGRGRGRPWR